MGLVGKRGGNFETAWAGEKAGERIAKKSVGPFALASPEGRGPPGGIGNLPNERRSQSAAYALTLTPELPDWPEPPRTLELLKALSSVCRLA